MPAANLLPIAAGAATSAEFTLTEPTLLAMVGPANSQPLGKINVRLKLSTAQYTTVATFTSVNASGILPAGTYVAQRVRGTVGLERA